MWIQLLLRESGHFRTLAVIGAFAIACAGACAAEGDTAKPSMRDIFYSQSAQTPASQTTSTTPNEEQVPVVRYWLERDGGQDRDIVVPSKELMFRSGDKVWFKFETNVNCYAYLVNKGTTNTVRMLFPGIAGVENKVDPHAPTVVPTVDQPFVFDENPGTEELCLVIAPKRIPEWEGLEKQARAGARDLSFDSTEDELWEDVLERCKILGKSRDLVLEQHNNESDGEPGAYVGDQSGFVQPLALRINIKHQP